jgi:hypothetical protein
MKKTTLIALLLTLIALPLIAWAAGTCTQTYKLTPNSNVSTLTFSFAAEATGTEFPETDTDADITEAIEGLYITEVRTNPGTTGPNTGYDITIKDTDGIDLMGGQLADRHTSNSEAADPIIASGVHMSRPIDGALTLNVSGNTNNAASTVIKVFLSREK